MGHRKTNRFGLSRDIPAAVKHLVRQHSGFGCVICGFAICQYEHVDPEFKDARIHDPNNITLLCGHCHDKKTRGILSKEAIRKAMLNPKCLQKGFTEDAFDVGENLPVVQFCDSVWSAGADIFSLLRINGVDLLKFEKPEREGGPFLLIAQFFDKTGLRIFWVEKNEWHGNIKNWDLTTEGRTITIRNAPRSLELQIENIPRERLVVKRIDMLYKGYRILGNKLDGLTVIAPNGKILLESKGLVGKLSGKEVVAFEFARGHWAIGHAMGDEGVKDVNLHIDYLKMGSLNKNE